MPKAKAQISRVSEKQGALFSENKKIDVDLVLCTELARACDRHRERTGGDRYALAAEMGRLTDGIEGAPHYTKPKIDAWCAPSKEGHRPSFSDMIVFCTACGDWRPLEKTLAAAEVGRYLVGGQDMRVIEIARKKRELGRLQAEIEALEAGR